MFERIAVLPLPVTYFSPGQRHTIVLEPGFIFRGERLVIPAAPTTRLERIAGQARWLLAWPRRALRELVEWRRSWPMLREELGAIWPALQLPRLRWPGKAAPLDIININVGARSQIATPATIPADLFAPDAPAGLVMDTAPAGIFISIELRSHSDKPYELRGAYLAGRGEPKH